MANADAIVVLDAGPGGCVAAIRAWPLACGPRSSRRGNGGGVYLNLGCIPSEVDTPNWWFSLAEHQRRTSHFGCKRRACSAPGRDGDPS
jgi:pyruvate/2-oxoglutarate dehydrogenase complex dihydrolipoamide dehydrogenase (E3) component